MPCNIVEQALAQVHVLVPVLFLLEQRINYVKAKLRLLEKILNEKALTSSSYKCSMLVDTTIVGGFGR